MITELDIYRAATLLINRYGDGALTEAAQMIDRMLANEARVGSYGGGLSGPLKH